MIHLLSLFLLVSGCLLLYNPLESGIFLFLGIYLLIRIKRWKILFLGVGFFLLGIILTGLPKLVISSNEYVGIIVVAKENYFIVHSGFSYYYVSETNNTHEVFDIIKLTGSLGDYHFYTYESQFDFNEYLKSALVFKQINVTTSENIFLTPIRNKVIVSNFLLSYNENAKSILSQLLFNTSYSDEYNSLVYGNSLFFLLSVSSIHIHFINRFLKKIMMIKMKERMADFFLIFVNLFILLISNYKIAIIRVFIYGLITFLNDYKKHNLTFFNKVSLTFIITIIFFPRFVLSKGFIYAIIIPLMLFLSRSSSLILRVRKRKYYRLFLLFLISLPLNLYFDGYFSFLSLPLTLFLSPLVYLLYFLGLIGLFLPISIGVNFFSDVMMNILKFINQISLKIYVGQENIFFVIIFYLLIMLYLLARENKHKSMRIYSLGLMISLVVISSLPIKNNFTSEVDFINVGQGDSCLVRNGLTNVLIDTGGIINKDIADDTLIPFLKKKRIRSLDYVFITHNDYDHNGAFETLKTNFKVKNTNEDNSFKNITINNLSFINLNPSEKVEDNEDSLVLYFTLNSHSFLLMGDAPISVEKKIIEENPNLKTDYLKIGHHGSNTSTSEEFIKSISPKEAIISVGKNYYGHPSENVLKILNDNQVKVRRTDLEGTIIY